MAGTEEIRGGGLHRSNLTVEKAHTTWPHQKPEAAFIVHKLLLDKVYLLYMYTQLPSILKHLSITMTFLLDNFLSFLTAVHFSNISPLTFQATHFWLTGIFFPTLTPPNSFIRNPNVYIRHANVGIYP